MADFFVPGATDPRHVLGIMGEEQIAKHLRELGFIVFKDWSKPVNQGGIDLLAYKAGIGPPVPTGEPVIGELWLIDNKAQFAGIRSPSSLTQNFESGLEGAKRLLKKWPSKVEADLALKAIESKNTMRVVSNALSGEATRFSASCFKDGLFVYDIRFGKIFAAEEAGDWAKAHDSLRGRRLTRVTGARGAATLGSLLIVLAVAGGTLLFFRAGREVRIFVGEMLAETALQVAVSKLPGGYIAFPALIYESDGGKAFNQARKRQETIYQIMKGFPPMTAEEGDACAVVIGQLLDDPLLLPDPEEHALPIPVMPTPVPAPGLVRPSLPVPPRP
jgi:hypothetical protein